MAAVDPATVAATLSGDVATAVEQLTLAARAYTRGRGFDADDEPNDEIAAVITLAAARLARNPGQIPYDSAMGDLNASIRGAFNGWTTAELAVLNRYRVRAK